MLKRRRLGPTVRVSGPARQRRPLRRPSPRAMGSRIIAIGPQVHSGPMLVGVDARALAARRGVARYTRRMVEALAALDGVAVRALVPGRADVAPVMGAELRRTRLPSRVLHMAGALAGYPRVDTLLG